MNQSSEPARDDTGPQPAVQAKPKATYVRYLVVAALCLGAFVAYVQRNSIGVAEVAIRDDLKLDKEAMGWVMSAFFLTYALLQLPTGWLGKVLGTRRGMTLFATVYSATAALFALAGGLPMLLISRLGMGAAQSGIFPCTVNSISSWLPDRRRSIAAGFLASFMSVGGVVGVSLMGYFLYVFNKDWRLAYGLLCLPGFVFAVLFYWWFRDRPEQHYGVNPEELEIIHGSASKESFSVDETASVETNEQKSTEATPWGSILTNVPILALCTQQIFRAVGYIFFASWFATFLRETHEVSTDTEVGILTSLPLLAIVIGSPVGGLVSDGVLARTGSRRWSRQGVATFSMLACCGLTLVAFPIQNAWIAVSLITAGSFFAGFGGPCAYTATIDMGGRHLTMVFSLMNMAGNFGAFVFPAVVPFLLQENKTHFESIRLTPVAAVAQDENVQAIVIAADAFAEKRSDVKRYDKKDKSVTRIHFEGGGGKDKVVAAEYDVNIKQAGNYRLEIKYDKLGKHHLRVLVNGDSVDREKSEADHQKIAKGEPQWITAGIVELNSDDNIIRFEATGGNWKLVFFIFAGMYFLAAVCWLLANPNGGLANSTQENKQTS